MEFQNSNNSNPSRNGGGVTPSKRKRSDSKQCFAFKKGSCEKGSDCKFSHGAAPATRANGGDQGRQQGKGQGQGQQKQQGQGQTGGRGRGGSNNQQRQQQPAQQQQQQQQQKQTMQSSEPRLVTSSARDVKEGADMEVDPVPGPSGGKAYMTQELFASLPISPLVKRALAEVMQYANMTQVSSARVVMYDGTLLL